MEKMPQNVVKFVTVLTIICLLLTSVDSRGIGGGGRGGVRGGRRGGRVRGGEQGRRSGGYRGGRQSGAYHGTVVPHGHRSGGCSPFAASFWPLLIVSFLTYDSIWIHY